MGKLPDRTIGAAFGASTTQQQREAQRLERERERLEKERIERAGQNQLAELTEEQREEINEAVYSIPRRFREFDQQLLTQRLRRHSLGSSISTKTNASTTTNSKSP